MSNLPSLTSLPTPSAAGNRQRLRAVRPDEVPPAPDFLPPGATWLPAPGHVLPAVAGGAPMVGYLVLVPAEPGAPSPQPPAVAEQPLAAGGVRIDEDRRTAAVDDRQLDLTYLEFELLAHLVAHPHRVHSRDQLVTTVWGYGHVGDGRTVDVHIARLRRKLGADHRGSIVTVRRVGYKYAPAQGDRVQQGATARR
ncbi:winged helix-turn-helix domain-containing protein [Streptomyces cocklensis]|uniref:Transcriptional regulatory protein, C terminal n=1 Tax=Actinacidiphila cocklensis TaxID=887465 RepID=A0A9W4DSM5_9ACTN|nr:winged helix-turn-helix domain-containing protein [Actinacidiphila cocklensis]MDD1059714.1 winged helix-turn-helix domain-containing protein [Actinacidiphila cocklensis]CAG6396987.1 Transcriptional regulatory protein, C terminal [Actinacidiphila cocklensis]